MPSNLAATFLSEWWVPIWIPTSIWSLAVSLGIAFVARRRGCALLVSVLATVLVVSLDVLFGLALEFAFVPDTELDFGFALAAVGVAVVAVFGGLVGLAGALAARVYGSLRPA